MWVLVSVGELVGVGLTAVAARRHGERDPIAAARATGTALALAAALGAIVAYAGIAGLPAILRLMNAHGEVAELARDFLVIQFIGAFLVYGYFVVTAAFRSAGDTRTPFYLLGGSVLLNLVLDPLMILRLGTDSRARRVRRGARHRAHARPQLRRRPGAAPAAACDPAGLPAGQSRGRSCGSGCRPC